MKNYSKEFWLGYLFITIGTHWQDWALPLRIRWDRYNEHNIRTFDIFVDILCFIISVEIFERGYNEKEMET